MPPAVASEAIVLVSAISAQGTKGVIDSRAAAHERRGGARKRGPGTQSLRLTRSRLFYIHRAVSAASDPAIGRSFWEAIGPRRAGRVGRLQLLVDLVIVAWLIWLFDAINNLAPVRQGWL